MTIKDAAKYIIFLSYGERHYSLTPLKLQQILYFSQGWSCVWDSTPLFEEEFEALESGPVNRLLLDDYKQYKREELPIEEGCIPSSMTLAEKETLEAVWRTYGSEMATTLVEKSCLETPWILARENGTNIKNDAIREYAQKHY